MQVHGVKDDSKRGFTLLETLTVLVVIGLLTSLAIVVYANHRRALRARSSAKQIEVLFTTARTLAINQNAHFQAVLDLSTLGIWIDRIDRDGQVKAHKITTPDTLSSYVRIVGVSVNGTAFTSGLVQIQFHPNGTSQSARIVLFNEGGTSRSAGEYYTIKLYGPTARSRTFPGERL